MIETQTDKPSVTFTIPSWILAIGKFVDYAAKTASLGTKAAVEGIRGAGQSDREGTDETKPVEDKATPPRKFNFHFKKVNFNFLKKLRLEKIKGIKAPFKKHPKIALSVLIVVLILGFAAFNIAKPNKANINGVNTTTTTSENSSTKINVNKKFDVAIKTQDGKETGDKLHVTITTIEKTDSIIAQDKPIRTKDGKIFLLVNMEIENTTKQELAIKPNDMVRFIDNEGRSFAPEVYNNGVKADAVSIKKTRVGYVVDSAQKTYKLMIGEVRVKQEQIEVSF